MYSQGNEKPRILILSTAYLPLIGGSELAIKHTTDRMGDFEFDMVTGRYATDAPLSEQVGRIQVFRAGGRWAHWTLFLPKLLMPLAIAITAYRLMRSRHYAAVHAYQASQAAAAAAMLSFVFPSVPLIVTLQEGKQLDQQSWLTHMVRHWIVRRATLVTVISSYLGAVAKGLGARKIVLVPNGVDIDAFEPRDEDKDFFRIVTVSRLVPKNNVAALIQAMPTVLERFPAATLHIVGSGPLQQALEDLVSETGISDSVEFAGSVSHQQLPLYVASAGLFARASLSEGFGSAFLEAMACKVPVVASAVGGIPDIIRDRETGLFADPQDPKSIATAIIALFDDATLREHVTTAAYEMVHEKYDWRMIADEMNSVYKGIIR